MKKWLIALLVTLLALPAFAAQEKKPAAKKEAAAEKSAAKKEPAGARKAETRPAPEALVDINSAAKAELMALKGIGPTYAERIIQNRPYNGKDDLLNRKILPQSTYNRIKDLVVAKQK